MDDSPSTSEAIITSISNIKFPSDVLKWMKANAKPQMALKLMQVCKYFQHQKFPYIVLNGISNNNGETWNYQRLEKQHKGESQILDIFPDGSLWITGFLYLYKKEGLIQPLLPKIAVCEIWHLCLFAQTLTFEEFKLLTACGTVGKVNLAKATITDTNDEPVALEDILQCLPNVKYIYFEYTIPSIISPEVAANSVPNLVTFDAYGVTEAFSFTHFLPFIMAHPSVIYRIMYDFTSNLSPMYKQQLQEYIDQVIKNNSIKFPPPMIEFPGRKSKQALEDLQNRYDNHHRRRD